MTPAHEQQAEELSVQIDALVLVCASYNAQGAMTPQARTRLRELVQQLDGTRERDPVPATRQTEHRGDPKRWSRKCKNHRH